MSLTPRPLAARCALLVATLGLALIGPAEAATAAPQPAPAASARGAAPELALGSFACAGVDTVSAAGDVTAPAIEVSPPPLAFAPASRSHARGAYTLAPGGALHLRHAPLAPRARRATWARAPRSDRATWRAPGHLRAGRADDEPSERS